MESVVDELSLLEKKNELWRKDYDERVKRMELHYEQDMAKIDEEFRKAVRKMELEFSARKEAVIRQYSGNAVSKGKVIKPIPQSDDAQPQKDCTSVSIPVGSSEQTSQAMFLLKSAVSQNIVIGDRSLQKKGEIIKTTPADSSSAYKQGQNTMPFATRVIRVACRKPHPTMKEQHRYRRRRRRRHRRWKQGNRHQSKTLLFDPGGYCTVASSGTSQLDLRVCSTIHIHDGMVLPSSEGSWLVCNVSKFISKFRIKIVQQMGFSLLPVPRGGMLRTVPIR
ncbi:uncharacterized protein LOC134285990 [Aedes albopictus]|uniref:Uncharacterized protein n=1 Tax=Aedes albopictus TaxID=7160 RepID=A0ABM1YK65_AEDAL